MRSTRETYTPGYTAAAVDFMARRTADSHAAFFRPYLKRGMRLLDCGCGPGSITAGLARRVNPGTVIGVDLGGPQLKRARDRAQAEGVAATFLEASVYKLPFGECEFDAVFSHALFEHLSEPLQALTEIRRTLKPGGLIGLRSPDWGGFVLHPWSEDIAGALAEYQTLQLSNGGDVRAGRKLAAWLRAAAFDRVTPSASYEIYPEAGLIAGYLAQQLDEKGRTESAEALREWSRVPDAMFAQAWFEAVGDKR
ncbi:MAG: methyltransferase domain-containing protein [Verrucomicrobia bacterium]|nr:methyltransferase domain-containing protein [Verrucomicrobiota bacterium]